MKIKNIDTSTTAGKIEVMRAYMEGKQLAWKGADASMWWRLSGEREPRWNWTDFHYGVVEEPRAAWAVYNKVGIYAARDNESEANAIASHANANYSLHTPYTVVKLVEESK